MYIYADTCYQLRPRSSAKNIVLFTQFQDFDLGSGQADKNKIN